MWLTKPLENTLVVRIGRRKAAYGYALLVLGAYASIALSAVFGITPVNTLFGFITPPVAVEAKHASKFHSEPSKLIPSNAMTLILHLVTSLLISLGYLS
jgi:1,4-dihydroxy-2-naphthoate octaprenyltransferase